MKSKSPGLAMDNPAPVELPPRRFASLTRQANDTPMVMAFRHLKPSWRAYLSYVDLAARGGDKDCDRYLKIYEKLEPKQQREHTPEQLCDMAQIPPADLIGAVCKAIWESKSAESTMLSAIAHPTLIDRTVKLAGKAANHKDRELFFRLSGSLPDRKGNSVMPSVNINFPGSAPAPNLPVFSGELESFDQESVNLARRLAPGTVEVEASGVPVPEPESEDPDQDEEPEDEREEED